MPRGTCCTTPPNTPTQRGPSGSVTLLMTGNLATISVVTTSARERPRRSSSPASATIFPGP